MLFDQYWGAVKYSKIYNSNESIDWDKLYLKWYPRIIKSKTKADFEKTLVDYTKSFDRKAWNKSQKLDNKSGVVALNSCLNKYLRYIQNEYGSDRKNKPSPYSFCNENINFPCFSNEPSYSLDVCNKEAYRSLALAKFWNVINYFYPYKNCLPFNWNDVLEKYVSEFVRVESIDDYVLLTRKLNVEILDPHAATSIQGKFATLFSKYPPFKVRDSHRGYVIVSSLSPFIKQGDKLIVYDSMPVNKYLDQKKELFKTLDSNSSKNTIINLKLKTSRDSLYCKWINNKNDTLCRYIRNINRKPYLQLNEKKYCFKESEASYYLNLACFSDAEFKTKIAQIKRNSELILDLREYPKTTVNIVGFFVQDTLFFGVHKIPKKNYPGEFELYKYAFITPKNEYYGNKFNKITILINQETISKAEYIACAFNKLDIAQIVGSNSSGAMGNLSFIELPGGVVCPFTSTQFILENGSFLFETGVIPDVYTENQEELCR